MADALPDTFDFIVIGAGPAGSVVASRLARSAKAPNVLLLEAGNAKVDEKALLIADRFSTWITYPDYNWGYKTTPQEHLDGRQVDYSRGRGLGGSSRINFAVYTIGPKGDYDHWANIVGDEFFNWENTRRRFNMIESYGTKVRPEYRNYIDLKGEHGTNGPLKVALPEIWEKGLTKVNDALIDSGLKRNLDINSGDPIGWGLAPSTGSKGVRSTALCFLEKTPSNLTILAESPVSRIVFDGKRAIGVKVGEKIYHASKEIILSAGALDTPKVLLLSGVGPKDELASHNIGCIRDLPGVGKNLRDHWFFPLVAELKPGTDDRASLADPDLLVAAQAQFEKDGTGPLAVLYNIQQFGWFRPTEELMNSEEYKALPPEELEHLKHPTVPTLELCCHGPPMHPEAKPDKSYLSFIVIGMLPQSNGTVTLASADPKDAPLCDPKLYSHPFDRRNAIEGTRTAYKLLTLPSIAEDTESLLGVPKSMSDEDIMEHAKQYTGTTWHMSCTAKMGKDSDPEAVVDTRFRVKGLEGLRVMDMSITPFLPQCHTVAVAYQIGEMGAERLIEEYGLA